MVLEDTMLRFSYVSCCFDCFFCSFECSVNFTSIICTIEKFISNLIRNMEVVGIWVVIYFFHSMLSFLRKKIIFCCRWFWIFNISWCSISSATYKKYLFIHNHSFWLLYREDCALFPIETERKDVIQVWRWIVFVEQSNLYALTILGLWFSLL